MKKKYTIKKIFINRNERNKKWNQIHNWTEKSHTQTANILSLVLLFFIFCFSLFIDANCPYVYFGQNILPTEITKSIQTESITLFVFAAVVSSVRRRVCVLFAHNFLFIKRVLRTPPPVSTFSPFEFFFLELVSVVVGCCHYALVVCPRATLGMQPLYERGPVTLLCSFLSFLIVRNSRINLCIRPKNSFTKWVTFTV